MNGQINRPLIIVGSNSIHTLRYINAIGQFVEKIVFITNTATQLPPHITCYQINFSLSNLIASNQIGKILKLYSNPIIHIHQANSYAYHTSRAIKKYHISAKVILTTWGSDILILPQKNKLLKKMVQFNLSAADIITSDSLYMSSKIRELAPIDKEVQTINFGIQDLPSPPILDKKEKIILSNRLHKPLYRIDKIIEAYSKIIKQTEYCDYRLIVAGNGEDSTGLKQLAKQLSISEQQIIFTGMVSYDELKQWYTKARIFISIPTSDATSLSLLEAMAYGCYPILSNLPANLEWVINEVNGSISENINKLKSDIAKAINLTNCCDQYQQLAQFNYNLIANKAQFNNNIKRFLKLYE